MQKMHPASQPTAAPAPTSSTRQGWLGHAEFTRQMALLRTGRPVATPLAQESERRRSARPLYRAMPRAT